MYRWYIIIVVMMCIIAACNTADQHELAIIAYEQNNAGSDLQVQVLSLKKLDEVDVNDSISIITNTLFKQPLRIDSVQARLERAQQAWSLADNKRMMYEQLYNAEQQKAQPNNDSMIAYTTRIYENTMVAGALEAEKNLLEQVVAKINALEAKGGKTLLGTTYTCTYSFINPENNTREERTKVYTFAPDGKIVDARLEDSV